MSVKLKLLWNIIHIIFLVKLVRGTIIHCVSDSFKLQYMHSIYNLHFHNTVDIGFEI